MGHVTGTILTQAARRAIRARAPAGTGGSAWHPAPALAALQALMRLCLGHYAHAPDISRWHGNSSPAGASPQFVDFSYHKARPWQSRAGPRKPGTGTIGMRTL